MTSPRVVQARPALRAGDRHLVRAGPGRAERAGLAPLRHLHRGDRRGARGRVPAAHVDDAGRSRGGPHGHDRPGEGVQRLCQRERAAGGDRLHRRAGGRQVRPGAAHQPLHGGPVRPLVARPGLQHRAHRRGDRAGIPEQHRARRRPLPGRAVGGPGVRFAARRSRGPAARRLPDVLRDGGPGRLVRAVDDGHVGQSDRHPDREGVRARDRLRQAGSSRPRCPR